MYKAILKEVKYNIPENDFIEIYHLNLAKLRKEIYNEIKEDELKKILYMFVCEDEGKLKRMYEGDEVMGKVLNISKELKEHFDELLYYNKEELDRLDREEFIKEGREEGIKQGIEEGLQQGIKQGIKQGIEQTKTETAKSLLRKGFDKNTIMEITNLSIDKLNELEKEL